MVFLTFKEVVSILGSDRITIKNYNRFISKAEEVIDQLTNRYYRQHKLQDDPVEFRVEQFKKAICMQLLYFSDMEADTFEGLNREPEHISIGRTSISKSGKTGTGNSRIIPLVAQDVYGCLAGTGLLYRGI
ncbi:MULTISPECIES: hypothetical protein [unclassified Streptococcus]|uniref:hypothetical protein n=1 Tax=unclassified Streptococcus TaxID=2608887 RepID=UPI001071A3E8|nr:MULTISPECIES: hypothetical protein [unclassified Streptococcus]MBF0788167.1 hypothetical protein [Streptococcus sp. 19428wC2_LYSM12]MCQ9212280.1 hypothetical protein [Streptococcus sp. B01]MCQ9213611.1 hypothetical protein [Streptococcus sp. O1]TFV04768.1 hypothetical protein E4T79_09790 [Streptococcus sp. LYSM12]